MIPLAPRAHRTAWAVLCGAVFLLLFTAHAPSAQAAFGLSTLDVSLSSDSGGTPATQAGSHPYAFSTELNFNAHPNSSPDPLAPPTLPDADVRDVLTVLPPGLIGNPSVAPACSLADFGTPSGPESSCPRDTRIGTVTLTLGDATTVQDVSFFTLETAPGDAATFGFYFAGVPVLLDARLSPDPPYRILVTASGISQATPLYAVKVKVWGSPADPAHDAERGGPASVPNKPFLTLPRSCPGTPLAFDFSLDSWANPGATLPGGSPDLADPDWLAASDTIPALGECANLGAFDPVPAAAPSTDLAESPSGFDFSIDVDDPGLSDPAQRAQSDLKKAVVTLPQGMAVNPAAANGLATCSPAQLASESADSDLGAGCPAASRVASVSLSTPLIQEQLSGSVFLATPYQNPFDTLLAGYLVIRSPERGIIVKLAGRIDADPDTGRLIASFDENPQFPFSHLEVHFKTGPHAPLITPQACGDYAVRTELAPWSGGAPLSQDDHFQITASPSGGACPTDSASLPNAPSFDAGTLSPISDSFSPFVLHLRREDGSQRFAAIRLSPPPGLLAKLAGTAICPEAALAAAAQRSGAEELAAPSCPPDSHVGKVQAGAGSGPSPYYAPGTAYLAGPYKSAPLSLAIITPAVAGPFDLGTVVIRTALYVDSKTAQIRAVSDPIPEILQGIPLDLRSVDVALDRPDFTLTGTSCDPLAVSGTLTSTLGQSAPLLSPYQLSDCARLPFKPQITLRLSGGTRRTQNPALTVILRPRPGDANIASLSLAMPPSEFLDNAHIGTVCTRVQFAADACPPASVYGTATVSTPILDYPLSGNVYLRSSENPLPDLVPDLRGPASQPLRVEAAGRTDTVHGGLRNSFDFIPDAPFTELVTKLPGGRRGLLENSRDICARTYRATVRYTAHNGLTYVDHPKLRAGCKKAKKHRKHNKHHRRPAVG